MYFKFLKPYLQINLYSMIMFLLEVKLKSEQIQFGREREREERKPDIERI